MGSNDCTVWLYCSTLNFLNDLQNSKICVSDQALEILHRCMQSKDSHRISLATLNVLAKVALHLQLGDQAEAEAALFSINMVRLVVLFCVCVYIWMA